MDLSGELCVGLGGGTATSKCVSRIKTTVRYKTVYSVLPASLQGDKSLVQLLLERERTSIRRAETMAMLCILFP